MRAAVILSTYDQPEWLQKALWGYARQTHRDFEVVVADDGSDAATRAVIDEARAAYPGLELRHVWHPDRGYRKCVILNRAILAADAPYLIFSDGDCIPRHDFVATHVGLARPGAFLSGGAVRLPKEASEAITEDDVVTGRAFDVAWLVEHGFEPGRRRLRFLTGTAWPAVLDALTPTRATWNGGNASTWRDVVVRANGFEHEMGYGGQDREFGERLRNLGIDGVPIRHRAVTIHLEHGRPYRSEDPMRRNRELRDDTVRSGRVRARCGIDQLEDEAEAFVSPSSDMKGLKA